MTKEEFVEKWKDELTIQAVRDLEAMLSEELCDACACRRLHRSGCQCWNDE